MSDTVVDALDALEQAIGHTFADRAHLEAAMVHRSFCAEHPAAVIYDPDYEDTANVLELLNVELLEARYIDRQLDKRITEYASLVRKRIEWPIPLRTPYRKAIEDMAELRLESALLSERVENALKLVGDLFLARLHSAAAQRFYLQEWETIISRKLELISDFYDLLSDRLHTVQSQTLELIVILLILVEVILPLIGWH